MLELFAVGWSMYSGNSFKTLTAFEKWRLDAILSLNYSHITQTRNTFMMSAATKKLAMSVELQFDDNY